MSLFYSTHHTFVIEPWNENGVHVLDLDTQNVRLLLRNKEEVDIFIHALRSAEQGVQADEKPVAWLNENTGAISISAGGGYDIPLFRR